MEEIWKDVPGYEEFYSLYIERFIHKVTGLHCKEYKELITN